MDQAGRRVNDAAVYNEIGSKSVYNELDPYVAQWLENLVGAGHIAPGRVERRSIVDLTAADVAGPGRQRDRYGASSGVHLSSH